MKFEISASRLNEVISKCERVTSKKTALPILSNIYLEVANNELIIRATNLELAVEARVPITNASPGSLLVDASLFKNFLSQTRTSQALKASTEKNNLILSSKLARAELATEDPEEFPSLPNTSSDTKEVKVSADDFKTGVNSVWYAAAASTMKPELSSIYIHTHQSELYFVATDTFRLAEKVVASNVNVEVESLLIPQQNAVELTRILDDEGKIMLEFDENLLKVTQGDVVVTARVVDGSFPDYRQIIPSEFSLTSEILYYDFESALRLSSIFADKYYQVTLEFSDDNLIIDSKGTEHGKSTTTIKAVNDGSLLSSKFNQKYLTDALSTLKGDNLQLQLSENKPLLISNPADTTFKYLVMPMHQ